MESPPRPASSEAPGEDVVRHSVEARRTAETQRDELAFRLHQQHRLAELGRIALCEGGLDALLDQAAELCAKGMETELCKVLEWRPEEDCFLVRAGVGWKDGVVRRAIIPADMNSPAGYALKTGQPVVSNDLASETRFRTPAVVREHGARRAVNALIPSHDRGIAFGVIEVDSPREGHFDPADVHFMTTFADLLGLAIERRTSEAERERMARSLSESEERLRLIIESLNDYAIIITNSEGRITSWSPGAANIFGYQAEEVLGQPVDVLFTPEDRAAGEPQREIEQARRGGLAGDQRWHLRRDGRRVFLNGSLRPLGGGEAPNFLKIAQDETARRRTEELQQHLARELSHRVKNSLQLVSALLALQSRTVGDEKARAALADARARIQTVAQVHDQLWRQDDATDIELSNFLESLLAKLKEAQPDCPLIFKGEPSIVSTERAIAIGLIANELVTNAFKYACTPAQGRPPGSQPGEVRVTVSRLPEGVLRLEVADRGPGLPPGFDPGRAGSSLGMRVVTGLADQLHGRLEVADNAPGAVFAVVFPASA